MSTTESASPRYASIETWSPVEIVNGIVEGQFTAIAAVQAARQPIAEAIEKGAERLKAGGRLIYLGAGTSGRIAIQDASELPATFSWPFERVISIMAGGASAFTEASEGAEDSEEEAIAALDEIAVGANDVVLGLAASGRTPFAVAGLVHARSKGALTVGIYNNAGGRLGEISDIAILLDTGPEVLAGSTRMKAGTAQKAVLNCISTGIMMQLGYVYRGLMVEMRASNFKLKERAVGIVAQITGAEMDTAREVLERAGYSIKLAVIMIERSLHRAAAEAMLADAGGDLRKALEQ